MHDIAIRPEIVERVVKRRGRVRLFERLDPARTAAVYIDMQVTFLAPGRARGGADGARHRAADQQPQ